MRGQSSLCFGALVLEAGGTGVGTYARQLLSEMAELPELNDAGHTMTAVVQSSAAAELPPTIEPVPVPDSAGARRALYGKLPRPNVDLFHSLDADLPVSGPRHTVATIHDLSVFDVPWAFTRYRALGERALLRHTLRTADALIAVSQFTAERVYDLSGREAAVTPLAPARWAAPPDADEVARVRAKHSLPERFILQVGTIEPRKRPHVVAEAARALDVPFVVAGQGSTGPHAPSSAIGLGYIDVADLPGLYRAATIVTYASVYEGFGLPPIEAMACGAVVVASRVGGLPDVAAGGARLMPSLRLPEWVSVLGELMNDEAARDDLRVKAVAEVADLTWRRTAQATARVYAACGSGS